MNWKKFLRPTPKKIVLFLLLWLFLIVPGPSCFPDGPCMILTGFNPFIFIQPIYLLIIATFKIFHLIYPWAICDSVLINCVNEGAFVVIIFWLAQLLSFVASYFFACLLLEHFKSRKRLILSIFIIIVIFNLVYYYFPFPFVF